MFDLKSYDLAFVEKLGAAKITDKKGYYATVEGITEPVPVLFDLPAEWWTGVLEKENGRLVLPAINVRRVDLVPDPKRFLPAFKAQEVSTNPDFPNTFNIQKDPAQPVTILYEVELASEEQWQMNALLQYVIIKLPTQGYGTTITVFGTSIPFHSNSVRNLAWNRPKIDGRKFGWGFTYGVEGWLTTTECVKVKQILDLDITYSTPSDLILHSIVVTETEDTEELLPLPPTHYEESTETVTIDGQDFTIDLYDFYEVE